MHIGPMRRLHLSYCASAALVRRLVHTRRTSPNPGRCVRLHKQVARVTDLSADVYSELHPLCASFINAKFAMCSDARSSGPLHIVHVVNSLRFS
jgi:hypothetical protein